jgi:hypothetical protein
MQQLRTVNDSQSLADALAARTGDSYWTLATQYLSGEFETANGGGPVDVEIAWFEYPLTTVQRGGGSAEKVDRHMPLEYAVESEDPATGLSPAWRRDALEYRFVANTAEHELQASDYDGLGLDWFHFDLSARRGLPDPTLQTESLLPSALTFPGAPHPRWWQFESADSYFDSPVDPEPNILSMMLPEFFLIDSQNWFLAPLPQAAGSLRRIVSVTVTDSFGIKTAIPPTTQVETASDWSVFALTDRTQSAGGGGELLFIPNVALQLLENDELEEVVFRPDQDANLVWAEERLYQDPVLGPVRNGEAPPAATAASPTASGAPLQFLFRSPMPAHWIPYVPRTSGTVPPIETYLRRGRTVENTATPQYHSRIVAESWKLLEEEIAPPATRVRRIQCSARGSDGTRYGWIRRQKESAVRVAMPALRFDYLRKP